MRDQNQAAETLSAVGIRLRRGETALTALTLAEDSTGEGSGNRGCLVLTDQRIFHISGGGAQPTVQSALLRDVAAAGVEKQSRYMGFSLAAGFVFIIGIPFEVALAVSGAFSGTVLGAVLLLAGGFLVLLC